MKSREAAPVRVCALEDIVPNAGVAALVDGEQVAIFRLDDDSVYVIGNRDPFSGASVLSRDGEYRKPTAPVRLPPSS